MRIWRNLYSQSFRTAFRDYQPSGLVSSHTVLPELYTHYLHQHYRAATCSSQSANREKSPSKDIPAVCLYKFNRTRRLMNCYPTTMNKTGSRQTVEMATLPAAKNSVESSDLKPSRRPYTETELAAAVRAICFDRLGTRRAASVYGIPRSTLRNKICKLNELKRREEERLGGKSIVMADFLHSLIRTPSIETKTPIFCTWSGSSPLFSHTKKAPQTMGDDPECLLKIATDVASIFQVSH